MNKFFEELNYLKTTLFHPFDTFYEIKWHGKGNSYIASFILLTYTISAVLAQQYTGFIVNYNPIHESNSLLTFIMTIVPILLFIVSNWSVTTLCNGKGNMKDLYMVIGYSLFPLLVTNTIGIFISNIIIVEEVALLLTFQGIGLLWFLFLAFCGITSVHEYTVKESIVTLVLTAIAAFIIIFLFVLYFSLVEQLIQFISTITQESMRRW